MVGDQKPILCIKRTTYWVFLFHILHVKHGIKIPNMSCVLFIILASDPSTPRRTGTSRSPAGYMSRKIRKFRAGECHNLFYVLSIPFDVFLTLSSDALSCISIPRGVLIRDSRGTTYLVPDKDTLQMVAASPRDQITSSSAGDYVVTFTERPNSSLLTDLAWGGDMGSRLV